MKRQFLILIACMVFVFSASSGNAQVQPKKFSLSPYIGGFTFDGGYEMDSGSVFGLRLGYDYTKNIGVEATIEKIATELETTKGNVDAVGYRVEGLYFFMPDQRLVPFFAAGLGGLSIDGPAGGNNTTVFALDYGIGVRYYLNDRFALRGDVRNIWTFDAPHSNYEYTIGISYYCGKKAAAAEKDSDGDGVYDSKDACPGTPRGVTVDASGCPLDSDGDGVYDYLDKCPGTAKGAKVDGNGCPAEERAASKDSDGDGVADDKDKCPETPKAVKVDANGCPLDSDGDGVYDYLDKCPDTSKGTKVDADGCPVVEKVKDADGDGVADDKDKCPDTPKGITVDVNGCPLDADSDGVYDYLDKCPGTPKGVKVDSKGCPLDSDGDGVYDYLDKCPDTPKNTVVDKDGCPLPEKVSITLNVQFDTGKSDIKAAYHDEIKKVADFMAKYEWTTVEIAGHTDNVGNEDANVRLSQSRADSVKTYLIEKFGMSAGRVKAVGYGPKKPIADNTTTDGRQKNRRVEAVIETTVNKTKP